MAASPTRFFGETSGAAGSYFGNNSEYNALFNEAVAQAWLNDVLIEPLEEERVFEIFGRLESIRDGFLTNSWARPEKLDASVFTRTTSPSLSDSSNTIGVSPALRGYQISMTSATPEQFVCGISISDMVQGFNRVDYINAAMRALGNAAGRLKDAWTQDKLYAGATAANTTIIYHGTGTAPTQLSEFTAANAADCVMKLSDISKAEALMFKRGCKPFGMLPSTAMGAMGAFVIIVSGDVHQDLRADASDGAFMDLMSRTEPQVQKLIKGYMGTWMNIAIVRSNHVQAKAGASNQVVWPSYVLSPGAFGVLKYRYNAWIIPDSAVDKSDFAGQRNIVSMNLVFNAKVLDPMRYQLLLSTATATNA